MSPSRESRSLADRLADNLRKQIADGLLATGDKLPSIRAYAKASGCSKNTVISAFDTLTASGLIEPRRGSGYYVTGTRATAQPPDETPTLDRAMDTVWLMREQLRSKPDVLNLGEGFPPVEWLTDARIDQFHQRVARMSATSLFRYGSRFGYQPLRQHLQKKLAGHEIEAAPTQIVLTHGANQAMDMVLRYFVRADDTVLVDDPGYYALFGKIQLSRANIVGVPRLTDGPDVDVLEAHLKRYRPRLFFTQSVGHNPTATDTSAAKAHRILQLAEAYDLIIVENDSHADLKPRTAVRISALDQLRRTIYVGSFSKSVSAALRVGFLACHADLASDLADVKMLTHVSSSEYCERALDIFLSEGHFLRHTNRLQDRLRHATAQGIAALTRLGATVFKESEQSLYLWASLQGEENSLDFAAAMLTHNVILAPGTVFSAGGATSSPWFRFNVGYLGDTRFAAALAQVRAK